MQAVLKIFLLFCNIILLSSCATTSSSNNSHRSALINSQLGLIYFSHGEVTLAKHKLLIAEQQSPNDSQVQIALGYFFAHTGETKVAEQYYLSAIKSASIKGEAYYNFGTFLLEQQRYPEALHYFLAAATDIHYLQPALAYEQASFVATKMHQLPLAQNYHQKALQHKGY